MRLGDLRTTRQKIGEEGLIEVQARRDVHRSEGGRTSHWHLLNNSKARKGGGGEHRSDSAAG